MDDKTDERFRELTIRDGDKSDLADLTAYPHSELPPYLLRIYSDQSHRLNNASVFQSAYLEADDGDCASTIRTSVTRVSLPPLAIRFQQVILFCLCVVQQLPPSNIALCCLAEIKWLGKYYNSLARSSRTQKGFVECTRERGGRHPWCFKSSHSCA
jgi:hypothetical protein